LVEAVVHDGGLPEVYFAIKDVLRAFGIDFHDAGFVGVVGDDAVTVLVVAGLGGRYPIYMPVW
jgi:hypothetical protein